MLEFIFYGSYLVFILLPLFIFYKKINKKLKIGLILLSLLFIYARFIEPQIIIIQNTKLEVGFKSKIALISDLHLGVYKDEKFLQRVVNKINKEDLDYVFIAGDFTYEPDKTKLVELFKPLKDIKFPVYWVLGNHDVEKPGPKLREELIVALDSLGLKFLNNSYLKLNNFYLLGLGSHLNLEDDVSIIEKFEEKDNVIVLAHNPDTISKYRNNLVDLTLCGHTHGGQIKLPFIYKYVIPTVGDFDEGYTLEINTKLFTTSGLGESLLPIRFLNPPTIDILELN